MSEVVVTDAMVDAALDTWYSGNQMVRDTRADMHRSLTAALAVSGYGEVVEALKTAEAALADIGDADREPGDDLAWCERRAAHDLEKVRTAISRLTPAIANTIVSQGN